MTTTPVRTTTAYAACDATSCPAVKASAADCGGSYSVTPVMKVTTSAPDMPTSTAYLDMFGRAARTAVEGFGGTDRRVDVFRDARGRVVCESEPYHAGGTAEYTRYAYDIRDRLTGVTRPDGGATTFAYTAASNQVTATVTETVKASDGATTAATRKTTRVHNVLGELVSTTEGAERTKSAERVETRHTHDGAGRLSTVATGGQTTTFRYDAAGNRSSVTNPNLGATVTAGGNKVSVKFKYNGHGELTERTDARGATYYGYDKLGRRTCAADRDGTATWEYDQTNGTGLPKRRGYDPDTILTSASSCTFGGDFQETYAYNADARLKTVTTRIVDDANATTTLTRTHTYDDYGRLSSTKYPTAVAKNAVTITHKYNDRGYLAKLKNGNTALVEVTSQTARGLSKAETYGNGVETARTYDELGRLTDIDTTLNTTAIQDNAHAWRSDGSLEKRAARVAGRRGLREEKFSYDYLNRLTGATTHIGGSSTASRTLAFAYDLAGNLTTKTSDVPADIDTTAYAYASGTNRLSSATLGGVNGVKHTFAHDTSGHITRYNACSDNATGCANADDTFIDWNARGLAAKVTVGKSATDAKPTARDSLRYGPDGARYLKKSEWAVKSGNTTTVKTSRKYYAGAYEKTVTVGGDTVERIRVSDSVVHVRTTPASGTATAAFEYAHRDHLGSLEAVTDAAGKTLTVLGHDPYGERRNDWSSQLTPAQIGTLLDGHGERVSRGFTGHEHLDRTGLIHMNGRIYDPRLGRFLSPDPIVGDPTSSRSWNLYSYVKNNPLSHVDPTGELEVLIVTAYRCDWLCGEDASYWIDWWYESNGSWIRYSSSEGYSYSDEVIRSMVEQALDALKALDQSVADQPVDTDSALIPGTVQVIRSADKNGREHNYRIRGVICEQSVRCDDAWAEKVFDFVNRNDIPFTSDDIRIGVHDLLLIAPIRHEEHPDERWSGNRTLQGHPFHPGRVRHDVHFERDHLIYDVTGAGTGNWPSVNNAIGVSLFRPGVKEVIHRFGSPPTIRWYPRVRDIYP